MAIRKKKTSVKRPRKTKQQPKDDTRDAILKQKELATQKNEPWVGVLETHFDPENPSDGYFELDWNPSFIAQLIKAGYTGKKEEDIVNQWFETLCKGVLAETYEEVTQMQGTTFIQRRKTDDGKTEIS